MSDVDEEFRELINGWEVTINTEGSDEEPTVVDNNNNNRLLPPALSPNQMNKCECNICKMVRYDNQKSEVGYTLPIQSIDECGTVERMETIEINCPLVYKLIKDFLNNEGMPGGVSKFDPKYENNQKKEEGSSSSEEGKETEEEEAAAGIGSNGEDIINTPYNHNHIPPNIICINSGYLGPATPLGTGNIFLWEQFGLNLEEFARVMEQSPRCRNKDSTAAKVKKGKGKVVTEQMLKDKERGISVEYGNNKRVNFTSLNYKKQKTNKVGGKKTTKQLYYRFIPRSVGGMNNVDYLDYANQIARCINNCGIPPEQMKARNNEIDDILEKAGLLVPPGGLPSTKEECYEKLDAIVDVSINPVMCAFHHIILT